MTSAVLLQRYFMLLLRPADSALPSTPVDIIDSEYSLMIIWNQLQVKVICMILHMQLGVST